MSSAAKLGIFMLVILAVLGYFILRVEDIQIGGGTTKDVQVLFDSVAGLDEKSTVRVAGVRVGKVSKIALTPEGRALVTLQIRDDVQLRRGANVKVANLGLLGEKYLELDPGLPNAPAIAAAEDQTIRLRDPRLLRSTTSPRR
jgi:phospholipid/cholesterol/gamma-HCH transport system substrate-binding protein